MSPVPHPARVKLPRQMAKKGSKLRHVRGKAEVAPAWTESGIPAEPRPGTEVWAEVGVRTGLTHYSGSH